MNILNNKVAIVTGAGSGIGKATALLYAFEGAKVVVSDIDEKGGNATVSGITKKGGAAIFIKADTAIPSDHESLLQQTVKQYGGLHIACNNAGIGGSLLPVAELVLWLSSSNASFTTGSYYTIDGCHTAQ